MDPQMVWDMIEEHEGEAAPAHVHHHDEEPREATAHKTRSVFMPFGLGRNPFFPQS